MTLLERLLIRHEGLRLKPYKDTLGKTTIGIGRNLDDVGISEEEALDLCDNDIAVATREALDSLHNWFALCGYVRQAVIVSMIFNMGIQRFLGFKKMIAACESGDWDMAAHEMVNSEWANQVGERATELANMLSTDMPIDALSA